MDCRAATGQELFDEVVEMGEAPDFRTRSDSQELGWELTQLAITQRRLAQDLFFEVTDRVVKLPRSKVRHLFGCQIYMWFGEARDLDGLPFKKNDADAYDQLVEALAAYMPDHDQFKFAGDMPPSTTPPYPVHDVADVQFFAIPLMNAVPATHSFAMTGASFGLAFQSDHFAGDEWQRLQEVVRRKDKKSNNVLVISAGAPDRMGRCFTSEEFSLNS